MVTTDERARRRRMGKRIKDARDQLDLSQEELAAMVQEELDGEETVGQSMISRYENGRAVPEPPKRRALERLLKLEPGELQQLLEPEIRQDGLSQTDNLVVVDRETHERISRIEADVLGLRSDFAGLQEAVRRVLRRFESKGPGAK